MARRPLLSSSSVSRRSFLRASALGAGAAALPLGACSGPKPGDPTAAACPCPNGPDHWVEPAVWRVEDHPGEALELRVSEIDAPGWIRRNGGTDRNPAGPSSLFAYNGRIGGPTIRMRGDGVLRLRLYNDLGPNDGNWAFVNNTRFAKPPTLLGPDGPLLRPDGQPFAADDLVPNLPDWQLSGNLMYGPHMQRTTNFHTHGLHVRPGVNHPDARYADRCGSNPDCSHSDNVLLRVVPRGDVERRMAHDPPICLTPFEVCGQADYEFRIGSASVGARGNTVPTHPPGTHWYHPHPHGATYDQVSSGMAGFLIVEGDVDDALGAALADPAYRYRERVVLLQRVFDVGTAPLQDGEASGDNVLDKNQGAIQTVNGEAPGSLSFTMAAGAVERWRVLNGSVDGKGYVRIAVVQADVAPPDPASAPTVIGEWIARKGVAMWQLAFDGVTLVSPEGAYTTQRTKGEQIGPANRADFLFQAPAEPGEYRIYGVSVAHRAGGGTPPPVTCIAHLTVAAADDAPPPLADDFFDRVLAAVPVPAYLQPITDAEIGAPGAVRSRRLVYAGWGNSGYFCAPGDQALAEGGKNTMAITGMKYDPERPVQVMGLDAAEEWVLDNHSVGQPLLQAVGNAGTNAVDHPFHMHQNPFYVLAVLRPVWRADPRPDDVETEVPLWVNDLRTPRWQDVVPIPANGGRVVFRSRFPDYVGRYVNHCHLLQHEDFGMMQAVEIVDPGATGPPAALGPQPADTGCAAPAAACARPPVAGTPSVPLTPTPNPALHAAPYNTADPNAAPAYPKPTIGQMIRQSREIIALDGEIGPGGTVTGGTRLSFCTTASS